MNVDKKVCKDRKLSPLRPKYCYNMISLKSILDLTVARSNPYGSNMTCQKLVLLCNRRQLPQHNATNQTQQIGSYWQKPAFSHQILSLNLVLTYQKLSVLKRSINIGMMTYVWKCPTLTGSYIRPLCWGRASEEPILRKWGGKFTEIVTLFQSLFLHKIKKKKDKVNLYF